MAINGGYNQGGGHPMTQGTRPPQGQTRPGGIQHAAPRAAPPQHGSPQGARRQDDLSWTAQGQAAAQRSAELVQQAEQRRAEARERGFWPSRFRLKASPGNTGMEHMGRIIILDNQPGPRYWEHALRNPQTGWEDNFEPCNKDFGPCPLCPPDGQKDSYFVMLLTVLHIEGYWSKKHNKQVYGARNLMAIKQGQHSFFDRLYQQWGSLRGLEIQMIRDGNRSPVIGNPDAATPIVKHSEEDIVSYLTQLGHMGPRLDKDGKEVEPAGYYAHAYRYGTFLHRPDGERLRRLYGGSAPIGANDYYGDDQGQWGNQNNAVHQAAPPPGPGGNGYPPAGGMNSGHAPAPQTTTAQSPGGVHAPVTGEPQGRPRGRPGQHPPQDHSGYGEGGYDGGGEDDGWASSVSGAGQSMNQPPPGGDIDDEIPF